jgi:diaminopimelate decarboxylase
VDEGFDEWCNLGGGGGVNYEEEGKQRLGINDQHHI